MRIVDNVLITIVAIILWPYYVLLATFKFIYDITIGFSKALIEEIRDEGKERTDDNDSE